MQSGATDGSIAVRLEPGENVHTALLEVCARHGVSAGFVISGIGLITDPELGFLVAPGEYDHRRFQGEFELLSLAGNIAQYEGRSHAHLHVTLGNTDYTTIGGHLFAARVGVTVEVLLIPTSVKMERRVEELSGVPGLYIKG
jgi:predicted DNA-binding protein with PD1-like motif